jgi:hypothetical protein
MRASGKTFPTSTIHDINLNCKAKTHKRQLMALYYYRFNKKSLSANFFYN